MCLLYVADNYTTREVRFVHDASWEWLGKIPGYTTRSGRPPAKDTSVTRADGVSKLSFNLEYTHDCGSGELAICIAAETTFIVAYGGDDRWKKRHQYADVVSYFLVRPDNPYPEFQWRAADPEQTAVSRIAASRLEPTAEALESDRKMDGSEQRVVTSALLSVGGALLIGTALTIVRRLRRGRLGMMRAYPKT